MRRRACCPGQAEGRIGLSGMGDWPLPACTTLTRVFVPKVPSAFVSANRTSVSPRCPTGRPADDEGLRVPRAGAARDGDSRTGGVRGAFPPVSRRFPSVSDDRRRRPAAGGPRVPEVRIRRRAVATQDEVQCAAAAVLGRESPGNRRRRRRCMLVNLCAAAGFHWRNPRDRSCCRRDSPRRRRRCRRALSASWAMAGRPDPRVLFVSLRSPSRSPCRRPARRRPRRPAARRPVGTDGGHIEIAYRRVHLDDRRRFERDGRAGPRPLRRRTKTSVPL